MEAKVGTVVRAMAGREKGRFMVIVSTEEGYVYLADGKERKLGSPKKKNPKHVSLTKTTVNTEKMTDKELRKFLAEFSGETE